MDLLIPIITWTVILYILQFISYPWLLRVAPVNSAYGLSKIVGLLGFGYLVWIIGLITSIDSIWLSISLIIFFGLMTFKYCKQRFTHLEWVPTPSNKDLYLIEGMFLGTFVLSLIIYSTHPEIHWGEKPMDFTFLNYFVRLTALPPSDPWANGNPLGYYYLGTFIFSLLHKLSGLAPNYGYGVSLATVYAMLCVALFCLLNLFSKSKLAILGALLIVFLGNYDAIYLWLTQKYKFGFDLYWASSRTLTSPGMNEYPLWSLLFADLHAHVISLPFVAAAICFFYIYLSSVLEKDFQRINEKLLYTSFLWGALCSLNTWDFLGIGIFFGVSFLVLIFYYITFSWKLSWNISKDGLFLLLTSVIFTLPFHLTINSGSQAGWGYVYPEEFNNAWQLVRIHGHWLGLILVGFTSAVFINHRRKTFNLDSSSRFNYIFFLVFSLLPLLIAAFTRLYGKVPGTPWSVIVLSTALSTFSSYLFFFVHKVSLKITGLILLGAATLYSMAECFYLMDRMNTTFKSYHLIWTLLGISGISLLSFTVKEGHDLTAKFRLSLHLIFAAILLPALSATFLCTAIMATFKRVEGTRPSLNGTNYMEKFNAAEYSGIKWLNANIKGTPTIVEAFGASYQEFSRVTMHTGLPIVMGWEHHVKQRGTKDHQQRRHDVSTIYTSPNVHQRMRALNRYQTQLIIVGQQERAAYGDNVDEFFKINPFYFEVVYDNQNEDSSFKVYRHRYSKF